MISNVLSIGYVEITIIFIFVLLTWIYYLSNNKLLNFYFKFEGVFFSFCSDEAKLYEVHWIE